MKNHDFLAQSKATWKNYLNAVTSLQNLKRADYQWKRGAVRWWPEFPKNNIFEVLVLTTPKWLNFKILFDVRYELLSGRYGANRRKHRICRFLSSVLYTRANRSLNNFLKNLYFSRKMMIFSSNSRHFKKIIWSRLRLQN